MAQKKIEEQRMVEAQRKQTEKVAIKIEDDIVNTLRIAREKIEKQWIAEKVEEQRQRTEECNEKIRAVHDTYKKQRQLIEVEYQSKLAAMQQESIRLKTESKTDAGQRLVAEADERQNRLLAEADERQGRLLAEADERYQRLVAQDTHRRERQIAEYDKELNEMRADGEIKDALMAERVIEIGGLRRLISEAELARALKHEQLWEMIKLVRGREVALEITHEYSLQDLEEARATAARERAEFQQELDTMRARYEAERRSTGLANGHEEASRLAQVAYVASVNRSIAEIDDVEQTQKNIDAEILATGTGRASAAAGRANTGAAAGAGADRSRV
jgi:hypothetical protein